MIQTRTPIEALKSKLYRTKSARFNADERLRGEHKLASYTLMFLAVYIVALSIGNAYKVEFLLIAHSEFWSVALSVALLGIAALEAGNNREKKAYKLHDNAVKIDNLYRKALLLKDDNCNQGILDSYTEEYAELIQGCEENHCEIDVRKNDIWNTWLSGKERFLSFIVFIVLWLKHFGIYWLAILLPLILLLCPKHI